MTFSIVECEQRTPEWTQARLGRVTGSRASDMLKTNKDGGEAAGRRNLRTTLVLERLTGQPQESGFQSFAMQQGTQREGFAVMVYEGLTGRIITPTGFLSSDTMMVGCSLDGHVGDFEGIIEVKCPLPTTHLEYLRTSKIPIEYERQITHSLWISGAQWCDWLSWNPDFPEHLQTRLVRVYAKDLDLTAHELATTLFLSEVQKEYEAVEKLAEPVPA